MNPLLRAANPSDAPVLLEIERQSFSHPHWTAEDFLKDECTVAEVEGEVVGFLVSREISAGDPSAFPQREILNLAVVPRFRRSGIATCLLNQELSRKATHFLEVRESNLAALALYRKFGFFEVASRPNYYQSPPERAIVMRMNWC